MSSHHCTVCGKPVTVYLRYWATPRGYANAHWYPVCYKCNKYPHNVVEVVSEKADKGHWEGDSTANRKATNFLGLSDEALAALSNIINKGT